MDASPPPLQQRSRIWLPRIAVLLALAILLFFAGKIGLRWRHWVWDTTAPIRFTQDIDRGYGWGRMAAAEGVLNQYDKMQVEDPNYDKDNWLDYAPLRLELMWLWGRWSIVHYPHVEQWHQDHSYELTSPMLRFNLFMETAGLVAAFLLTRLWSVRRCAMQPSTSLRYFFRGWVPAIAAVLLLWFNPAIVLSAYGWPTWDLWIIPIFLVAALLVSLDRWFTAGLVLGVGAMLKGQQLIAVPVFVVWAMTLGRPLAAMRVVGGTLVAIALVALPWLVTYIPADKLLNARQIQMVYGEAFHAPIGTFRLNRIFDVPAILWVFCVGISATAFPFVGRLVLLKKAEQTSLLQRWMASPWFWRVTAISGLVILVGWPWVLQPNHAGWSMGLTVIAIMGAAIFLIRPRGHLLFTLTAMACALLLCMRLFHASSAWFDCGIRFGTFHWPFMVMGLTDNLPGILVADFNWPLTRLDTPAFSIPAQIIWHQPAKAYYVTIKTVTVGLFWLTLILSSIGLAMHARRRDSRVLIALVAPWLMFFCFPPQIHERYLVYAAGISCICAGVSVGMALLGIFISGVACLMTLHAMLVAASENGQLKAFGQLLGKNYPSLFTPNASGEALLSLANGTNPDLGYAVILCGLIFLYFSLAPRPSRIG